MVASQFVKNHLHRLIIPHFLFYSLTAYAFPINSYDFHLPTNTPSAIEAAMGGLNVTNTSDLFLPITSPTLLRKVKDTTFAFTFATSPKEDATFAEFAQSEPILKDNNVRGFSAQTKNIGLAYHTLAKTQTTFTDTLLTQRVHKNYSLGAYTLAFADSIGTWDWGISGKLFSGQLVYLAQTESADSQWVTNEFIDTSALGYGFDLGFSTHAGAITYAAMVYDVYSKINWEDNKSGHIRTRMGLGVDYSAEASSFGLGVNSPWFFKDNSFYNAYYTHRLSADPKTKATKSVIRFGTVSKDYKKQDNILFCLGYGDSYKQISFDLGLQSRGIKINQTQVFLTISIGE